LLVEGTTDASVYRHLEERFGLTGGTVLPCNGRNCLLDLHRRRSEFRGLKTAFLADRDLWLFGVVPPEFSDVIFTNGYSIENDVLDGESVERLLDSHELAEFRTVLDEICRWFAFEVGEYLRGVNVALEHHVNRLVPLGASRLDSGWCAERGFREPPSQLYNEIRVDYRQKLRGKQLLQCLVRLLSAEGRSSKFSRANLLEIAAKSNEHKRLDSLAGAVGNRLHGHSA
jgi:hypothetical protein